MRQLTLDDVVRSGQEGAEWKQQQAERARMEKQRAAQERANQAFTEGVQSGLKRHVEAGGDPNAWKPGDTDYLRGVEARGRALIEAGDMPGFMQNMGAADAQMRRITASALQQFQADRDPVKLAKSFYPTIFDGRSIEAAELVPGGQPGALNGAPSGPTMLRVKLDNGDIRMVQPEALVKSAEESLKDPVKALEDRARLAFLQAKTDVETGGKLKVEQEKGAQERTTESVRQANRLTLADAETQGRLRVTSAEGANRARVAGIEAASRKEVAKLNAKRGDGRGLQAAQRWQDMAAKHFGQFSGGMMGGTRLAGQATLDLAAVAQRIHEANKGVLTESQALDQAARFLKLNSPEPGLGSLIDKRQ